MVGGAKWIPRIDNHFLGFALASGFAAPLHAVVGEETTGLHYWGDSSLGKSTSACLVASLYGKPELYIQNWRATDNALEATAAAYSDCSLILDEIGQADGKIVGDVVYMLGNELGKARASDRGALGNPRHRWRLLFFSNGEHSLETYMAHAGRKIKAGQKMRMLSISPNPHSNASDTEVMGCYQNLYGHSNGSDLSDILVAATAKYHGTPIIAFLEKLVPQGENQKLLAWIEQKRDNFITNHLSEKAGGQARRAAGKFALVGAAGELAIRWGVLNWPKGEALRAADTCFKAWLKDFGGEGSAENRELLAHIRLALQKYGESRFTRWSSEEPRTDTHQPRTSEMWGYVRIEEDGFSTDTSSTERVFYIYPEIWRQELCKGFNPTKAATLLSGIGALETNNSGRGFQKKARLPGAGKNPINVYVVKSSALFATDSGPDGSHPGQTKTLKQPNDCFKVM